MYLGTDLTGRAPTESCILLVSLAHFSMKMGEKYLHLRNEWAIISYPDLKQPYILNRQIHMVHAWVLQHNYRYCSNILKAMVKIRSYYKHTSLHRPFHYSHTTYHEQAKKKNCAHKKMKNHFRLCERYHSAII